MKKMRDALLKVINDLREMAKEYAEAPSTVDWTKTDILADDHERMMSDADKSCKNGNRFYLSTDILYNGHEKEYLLTDVCRSKVQSQSKSGREKASLVDKTQGTKPLHWDLLD